MDAAMFLENLRLLLVTPRYPGLQVVVLCLYVLYLYRDHDCTLHYTNGQISTILQQRAFAAKGQLTHTQPNLESLANNTFQARYTTFNSHHHLSYSPGPPPLSKARLKESRVLVLLAAPSAVTRFNTYRTYIRELQERKQRYLSTGSGE